MGWIANIPVPQGHAAGVVALVVLDVLVPIRLPPGARGRRSVGVVLVLVGTAVNLWAVAERRRATLGAFRLEEPEGLVTSGPYALTRHPMYVGWSVVHLGVGLVRNSGWVFVTLPAAVAAEHRVTVREDEELARAFGEDFDRYRRRRPTIVELLRRVWRLRCP